jgi:hypothetical protein
MTGGLLTTLATAHDVRAFSAGRDQAIVAEPIGRSRLQ